MRKVEHRPPSSRRGYDADWRKLRDFHLANNPLCAVCASRGRTTAAVCVDHVLPVAVNPSRRLDPTNLRSCCRSCHDDITQNYVKTGINEPTL